MSQTFNNVSYQCNRLQEKSEINEKINVKSLRKGTGLFQTLDNSANMTAINCYCFYEYQISVN